MIDAQRSNTTEASTTIKNVIDAIYNENITDRLTLSMEPRNQK